MIWQVSQISNVFDIFARGGGGGSGGGGGGSGAGGIIWLLGYAPTHLAGAYLRRKLYNIVGFCLMASFTLLYSVGWFFLGTFGAFIAIAALIGGPAGYFGWFGKVSALVRMRAKKQEIAAALKDPAWDITAVTDRVQKTFMAFQQDWSTFNGANMQTYITPRYAQHMQLVLAALKVRGRRNAVDEPTLLETFPTQVEDSPDNAQDRLTFLVHGKAKDRLLETVDGQEQQLFEDDNDFYEYWHFQRNANNWWLDGISQSTENRLMARPKIEAFATANNMFYSPDWGWLLLPNRGVLFKRGKFGTSDINNHVIGMYKDLLVELYTYIPNPSDSNSNVSQYTIAQVALPKRYDSLIVDAKDNWLERVYKPTPKGYNKISMEWPDFNKRYNVFATNVEQVTAFELLHSVYMEKLFALPFKVSIEVVDNVVYLYTRDKQADYDTMFSILKDAFEEMKL